MSIQGVIFESRGVDHDDHRRAILTVFNADLRDFAAKQVKFAIIKEDTVLGGHYHNYDELFYLLEGESTFFLKDPTIKLIEEYKMVRRDRLFIPHGIAHKVNIKADSILVGCTEEPYVSPKHNDHKYEF